ncbi:MAG: ROK family transcriptional regulator [Rhodobacteraceae bacterium]|nr:ROK family transcriptional regulator [Paracoccaceae bacterium]
MADQTLAKLVNERNILTVLLRQPATRAELSRMLELTPPSISRLTADMMQRGLLCSTTSGRDRSGERELGRPGTALAINPEAAYFLGIEIGVKVLRFAVINLAAQMACSIEQTLPHPVAPEAVARTIGRQVEVLCADRRFRNRLLGATVTVPGLVQLTGHVVNLPIVGWKDLDLHSILAEVLPMPFTIENSANAAAFGAAYGHPETAGRSTLYLKVGTGCGGAAILDGRLFRGAHGTGMEVGHIRIASDGPPCSCGQRGCLETFVNLAALADQCRGFDWAQDIDTADLPARVAQRVVAGEPDAMAIAGNLARDLSLGLVSLVNLFNPETIIFGGGMLPLIATILPDLAVRLAAQIIPGTGLPDCLLSPLGTEECTIGAARIAHHRQLDVAHPELSIDLRLGLPAERVAAQPPDSGGGLARYPTGGPLGRQPKAHRRA